MSDAEGRVVFTNAALTRLAGWESEHCLGRPVTEVLHLVDGANGRDVPLPAGTGEGVGLPAGAWLVGKDGRRVPVEGRVVPRDDEAGAIVVLREIAGHGRATEASRGGNGRFEALFNQIAVGIAQLDLTGRFLLVNDRYCAIVGRPMGALMESRVYDTLHPEDLTLTEAAFDRVARGGPDVYIEKRHVRADGAVVWTGENLSAVRDDAGLPQSVVTLCQDTTDRKRVEEALRQSDQRLRVTYERASIGIFEVDLGGRFLQVNGRYCEILGYAREELLDRSFQEVVHPDDLPACAAEYERLVAGEIPCCRLESRCLRKDGQVVWVELTGCLIPGPGGLPEFGIGFAQDITDRKGAEDELRRAHAELERRVAERTAELAASNAALHAEVAERTRAEEALRGANQALRALIEASPLAIIALDAESRVTIWNPAAERTFGWAEGEVLGRPLPTIPESLQEEFATGLASSLRGRVHAGHETRRLRKDGTEIEVSLWTALLYDARGAPSGRMGVVEDITGRKRAEEARTALLRRIVTAQEEERLRVARELHDQMGQHLAALILGLKATQAHIQNPAAAAEAQRLLDLTDRLGQEVHRIALELRPTALDDWGLQTALTHYAVEWSRRARVPVQTRFAGIDRTRLPAPVESALYRTVQEALTNVLRHARAGRVSLIVERRPDHVLAIVEDDGRGFDVDAVMAAPDAGTRLGLLGMQERVALVGGALEVESGPGGTTLFIRIPLTDEEPTDHG